MLPYRQFPSLLYQRDRITPVEDNTMFEKYINSCMRYALIMTKIFLTHLPEAFRN